VKRGFAWLGGGGGGDQPPAEERGDKRGKGLRQSPSKETSMIRVVCTSGGMTSYSQ